MVQDEIKYPAIPSVLLPRLSQIGVTVEDAKRKRSIYSKTCAIR